MLSRIWCPFLWRYILTRIVQIRFLKISELKLTHTLLLMSPIEFGNPSVSLLPFAYQSLNIFCDIWISHTKHIYSHFFVPIPLSFLCLRITGQLTVFEATSQ
jgi:hypothetical protein